MADERRSRIPHFGVVSILNKNKISRSRCAEHTCELKIKVPAAGAYRPAPPKLCDNNCEVQDPNPSDPGITALHVLFYFQEE